MRHNFILILILSISLGGRARAEQQSFSMTKSLDEYIRQAKSSPSQLETAEGSLYTIQGVNASLFTDLKARHVNDILTIRVIESTQAQSSADAQTARANTIDLGVSKFLGVDRKSNLVSTKGDMQFKGDGSTQRSGSVSALLSGRVADVLPNGDLVIEAVKEVKVNNERQMVRLFGVVRPLDVGPDNVVLSGAIANMLLQIDGKGALSDNLKSGFLFKLLTKFWPF